MEIETSETSDPVRSWYQTTIDRAASNLHQTVAAAGLNMPVDEFLNSNGQFVVRIDLPGLEPEDIEARVCKRKIVIQAKRRQREAIPRENLIRSEVAYGVVRRSLPLPIWVRNSEVDIQYENGVLELRLETDPDTCPQTTILKPGIVASKRRSAKSSKVSSQAEADAAISA